MKTKLFFAFALVLCLFTSIDASAQLVINIRYTGENSAARKRAPHRHMGRPSRSEPLPQLSSHDRGSCPA